MISSNAKLGAYVAIHNAGDAIGRAGAAQIGMGHIGFGKPCLKGVVAIRHSHSCSVGKINRLPEDMGGFIAMSIDRVFVEEGKIRMPNFMRDCLGTAGGTGGSEGGGGVGSSGIAWFLPSFGLRASFVVVEESGNASKKKFAFSYGRLQGGASTCNRAIRLNQSPALICTNEAKAGTTNHSEHSCEDEVFSDECKLVPVSGCTSVFMVLEVLRVKMAP